VTRLFFFVRRIHQERKHSLWQVYRNLIERLQFLSDRGARGAARTSHLERCAKVESKPSFPKPPKRGRGPIFASAFLSARYFLTNGFGITAARSKIDKSSPMVRTILMHGVAPQCAVKVAAHR
jgi:hypothetical protein